MDSVGLLLMLRDITHKHDDSVQSRLSNIQTFLELGFTYQEKDQLNTDYYTLFSVKDGNDMVPRRGAGVPQGGLSETFNEASCKKR